MSCGKVRKTLAAARPDCCSLQCKLRRWPAGSSCAAIAPVRACSACAGDYEDPDRTAGEPDEEIDEDEPRGREDLHEAAEEEFPAEGV